jgi:hypothetical protein
VTYKHHTDIDSPNHSGRRPRPPESITLHWWGDPDHFSDEADTKDAEAVARYLCRDGGNSSANDVVTAGNVYTIVDPDNIAWHAGVWAGNLTSIGIEVDADLQVGTYETLAELVADYWRAYGRLPLVRHRDWKATACPGTLDVARVLRRANELFKTPPKKTSHKPKPAPVKPLPAKPDIRAFQRALHAVPDNIWGEDTENRARAVRYASKLHGVTFPSGVQYAQNIVVTLQDGIWGAQSEAAHDATVARCQGAMGVEVDGIWGPVTDQAYLDLRAAAIG